MQGEAQGHGNNSSSHGSSSSTSAAEPVRSRWTPKPEQILILESIFNSGMVNPPKDETVRIRKMLEKFGAVGDANVFYWFQNRRSRSRRRQRQLQAAGLTGAGDQTVRSNNFQQPSAVGGGVGGGGGGAIQYNHGGGFGFSNTSCSSPCFVGSSSSSSFLLGPSSSCSSGGDDGMENLYSVSGQMGYQEIEQSSNITSSILCPTDQDTNFHYQAGFITIFINGVPTEVPRGPIDMKAMFGEDLVLVHSSGVPLPVNEFGFLMHSLQHGEAYFLVQRPT